MRPVSCVNQVISLVRVLFLGQIRRSSSYETCVAFLTEVAEAAREKNSISFIGFVLFFTFTRPEKPEPLLHNVMDVSRRGVHSQQRSLD